MDQLKALLLNCTLKASPAESSSAVMADEIADALSDHEVQSTQVRVVDRNIRFGVHADEGDGDEWPQLRALMLESDILLLVTPIWLGQPSSVCKMVLERLDAELAELDDVGRMLTYGKVAGIGVVGNEDGAHHVTAELCQALADVGFTLPANPSTYWVGEAMSGVDYKDKSPRPEKTQLTTRTLATNLSHLARLLAASPYPPTR